MKLEDQCRDSVRQSICLRSDSLFPVYPPTTNPDLMKQIIPDETRTCGINCDSTFEASCFKNHFVSSVHKKETCQNRACMNEENWKKLASNEYPMSSVYPCEGGHLGTMDSITKLTDASKDFSRLPYFSKRNECRMSNYDNLRNFCLYKGCDREYQLPKNGFSSENDVLAWTAQDSNRNTASMKKPYNSLPR